MIYIVGAIIIFMLVVITFMSRTAEDIHLKGFWRADAEFCERAELEMFVLYLGDNVGYVNNCRNGYLLAANQQGIILNNPIKLTLSGHLDVVPGISKCKNYTASIDWQGILPEDPDAFPSKFKAAYYPTHGKLVFYHGDEVLASMWKDCQMSALNADIQLMPPEIADQPDLNADL